MNLRHRLAKKTWYVLHVALVGVMNFIGNIIMCQYTEIEADVVKLKMLASKHKMCILVETQLPLETKGKYKFINNIGEYVDSILTEIRA